MMRQIGRPDGSAMTREVAWTGTHNSPEIDDLAGNQRRIVECSHAQRNVHVLAEDVDNAVGDQEIECDLRVALQEIRQDRDQMMNGNDRKGMHTQVPARRKASGCNIRFRGLDSGKDLASMREIDL